MATGRTRFYSECQCAYVEFTYVLPNDLQPIMVEENPYYKRPMKTLYLLHGFTGNDRDWEFNGMAEDLAVRYNLAIFMISAGNNFYLDRAATGAKYGEFAGKEIVEYTRKTFYLSTKREDTLIGGLSMGGFGALHTAWAFPDTFGGVVALSSALIIYNIQGMKPGTSDLMANYEYYHEVFGDLDKVAESENNPEVLYKKCIAAGKEMAPLYVAIGLEDFLYEENQIMRKFLEKEHAHFKYEEGHGIHDWNFWNAYITKGLEYVLKEIESGKAQA